MQIPKHQVLKIFLVALFNHPSRTLDKDELFCERLFLGGLFLDWLFRRDLDGGH